MSCRARCLMSSTAFAPDDQSTAVMPANATASTASGVRGQARRRRASDGGSQDYYEALPLPPIATECGASSGSSAAARDACHAADSFQSSASSSADVGARLDRSMRRMATESFDIDSSQRSLLLSPRSRHSMDADSSLEVATSSGTRTYGDEDDVRADDCFARCCETDPLTIDSMHWQLQSQTGHDDATAYDFLRNRVHFGDGFWSDLWFYLRNSHSLLALIFQHPNHPYKRGARCGALFVTLAYALLLTSVIESIVFSTDACSQLSCSSCMGRPNFNLQIRNYTTCPRPPYTWMGVNCDYQSFFASFGRLNDGCRWFARRPSEWTHLTDATQLYRQSRDSLFAPAGTSADLPDPGNGCIDAIYAYFDPSFRKLFGPHAVLRSFSSEPLPLNGECDDEILASHYYENSDYYFRWRQWVESVTGDRVARQSYMPRVCDANGVFLRNFLNDTADGPLAIIVTDANVCAALPAPANASMPSFVDSPFNIKTGSAASWVRIVVTQCVSLLVLLFSRVLSTAATCPCARRGERRRITVCCFQSAASLCYAVAFIFGLGFLYGGLAIVSLTPGTAIDQWRVIGQFALTKVYALGYEVLTNAAFFTVAYKLQRDCRYSACCVCMCGCCGLGLHAAPDGADLQKHVAFRRVDGGGGGGGGGDDEPRQSLVHALADDERAAADAADEAAPRM